MADKSHPASVGSSQASHGSSELAVKNTTPVYEIGFHLVPTVGDEGVSGAVDSIRTALGDSEIISEVFPQKMTLAYQVERATQGKREKYTESYFGTIKFAMMRDAINAFTAAMHAQTSILRFILIETVREDTAATPRRAVFSSDRLEGKHIEKPIATTDVPGEVSEVDLDKSLEALTG